MHHISVTDPKTFLSSEKRVWQYLLKSFVKCTMLHEY